jgi:glycosyltransferase involved in cell wall biosynthesis
MKLSVIIPAHNEEHRLSAQLDALIAEPSDGDWEVIVVDNASTDGTADLVREYMRRDERIQLICANERADQSYAANSGVAAAAAPAVAFCDADDIVASGWVAAMITGLGSHDVVTGPNELHCLNPPWLASSRGASGEQPVGTFAGIFPIVHGNNYGVRQHVWDITGPLNDGYFPVADQEFSFRCWMNGIDIVGLPDAVVHYRYRSSMRDLWRQGFAYGSHRPIIARLVKESGRASAPKLAGWKSWALLIVKLPTVYSREGRAAWVWILANRLGQVVGSVRERTVML